MTEVDLEAIVRQGVRRVRVQHALKAALAALGVTLICVALMIFALRWFAASSSWTTAALLLIPVATIAVLLATFARHRPAERFVALRLDTQAKSADHLLTWWELRTRADSELNDLQRGFKNAQRDAALKLCANMNPSRLLPLKLPSWSRALWLAVLFVLCALLMPEHQAVAEAPTRAAVNRGKGPLTTVAAGGSDSKPPNETPRIEPLSPTEMFKLKFELSSSQLTPEQREKIFRELKTRVGDIPRNALPQDVQDILNMFEKDSVAKKADAGEQSASAQKVGNDNDAYSPRAVPGIANVPEQLEKAFTRVREQYPDVQSELQRYYSQSQEPR